MAGREFNHDQSNLTKIWNTSKLIKVKSHYTISCYDWKGNIGIVQYTCLICVHAFEEEEWPSVYNYTLLVFF